MTGPKLEHVARLGYAARGAVYCLVGGLALMAAIGSGGDAGGNQSALQSLLSQPLGWVLLGIIAIGLACHAFWRFVESLTDADHRGTSAKALAVRGAHLISGVASAGLAISAASMALGRAAASGGGDNQAAQDWTAWLLSQPFGQILTGIVGAAVIAAGFVFVGKGWRGDVTKHLKMTDAICRWAVPLGRLGYAARGVVFFIIGGFLIMAAIRASSAEAKGLGGALDTLREQPYGWVLLALTAAGFIAFGLFGIAQARYRHIDAPDAGDMKRAATRHVGALRS
ncbi:membrane protein [Agaricicola taiwanensis]|uniref:Membrane protein n=1 Tax=Agaricicola taiwanensis TaxID=591372 RepID=A0A8J2YLG8_9RHOB|nr:DUF1206 domain-containing protein [Agaricicola taiwanensis]GGE53066.1 membrane protein [Agaricicola taiwanensis]